MLRKRALRRLSHEQPVAYSALYEQVLSETSNLTRYQVRGQAWTRLRYKFPDRYLELYALELSGTSSDVPSSIRGKSWQRASTRLADFRTDAYQARFTDFRAQGMAPSKAYERAIAIMRHDHADFFSRLLAEEYQLWLT